MQANLFSCKLLILLAYTKTFFWNQLFIMNTFATLRKEFMAKAEKRNKER